MTVCIATISNAGHIVGASDRMLTVGGLISFAPPLSKVESLTTSIAVMYAGETAMHTEVMNRLHPRVAEQISKCPSEWISVVWAAMQYRDVYLYVREQRATASILAPLGLTLETFLTRSAQMSPMLVEEIRRQLAGFAANPPGGGVAAIVAGVDAAGTFLFRIENGAFSDETKIGFATIGNGGVNADYELMLAAYSTKKTPEEALIHTYVAKRRAEVAPFVGPETDMFVIGPTPGTFSRLPDEWLDDLDPIYRRMRAREAAGFKRATADTETLLERLAARLATKPLPPQATPEPSVGAPPEPLPLSGDTPEPRAAPADSES